MVDLIGFSLEVILKRAKILLENSFEWKGVVPSCQKMGKEAVKK